MNNKKKRNIIIEGLCAVVLLMVVGYAAFQTVLNIQGTSNITSNWNVKIINIASKNIVGNASDKEPPIFENLSATFKTNLILPGDSIEYEVTIKNEGNLNAILNDITLSDTNNPAIKFTTSGLAKGDELKSGKTATLLVKVEYLSSISSQPNNVTSNLTVNLEYGQVTGSGLVPNMPATDVLKENLVTSGDGLYEDVYESGRYVYKGTNPNNYITFNNESWRIVSLENDGALQIIKDEMLPEKRAFDSRTTETTGPRLNDNNTYCRLWNDDKYYGCNAWNKVSGEYVNNSFSGTVTQNSELNTYLNGEYYNRLNISAKNQIQNYVFKKGSIVYGATVANVVNLETKDTWNGNIALLSLGDWFKASTNLDCTSATNDFYKAGNTHDDYKCSLNNYLYKGDYWWWLLNPHGNCTHGIWEVSKTGGIDYGSDGYSEHAYTEEAGGVRPVLYLKSDITLSGEGTSLNPYVISS